MLDWEVLLDAIHSRCPVYISLGFSADHDRETHRYTSRMYLEAINADSSLSVTEEQVAEAIIEATGWDERSPWPGHPRPERVVEALRAGQTESR